MPIYEIDPLRDSRWSEFLQRHPRASVFHTVAWLESLWWTYGYKPIAFTISPPGRKLENALVFCDIKSWLTGRRLVSLPFSDHCEPLVDDQADQHHLFGALEQLFHQKSWRYIEIRPLRNLDRTADFFHESEKYCFHQLDLSVDLDTLFRRFHKDSTQRKIRRAEREGLSIEEGRSETLVDTFYRLQLLTRRRHQLPPQPRSWFRNLADRFGETLKIRVASKDRQPVAAILTLRFKDVLVYKYGCSDSLFNNLGGMQLLFWSSIREAKESRLRLFDLGRSDCDNDGLITFKDRWGATRSTLTYARYPACPFHFPGGNRKVQIAKHIFAHAPDTFLCAIGGFLYKHIG
jgi:CelD/BcsL family acetyltransferase involved in cellulose biosynthesis